MTKLRAIFSNDYHGIEIFLEKVLKPIFGDYEKGYDDFSAPEQKEAYQKANISQIKHAATFEFYGSELKVFDVTVSDDKKLEKNKVGIQTFIRRYIEQFEGALIVFHHQNTENAEWRLSYLEKRESAKNTTTAKRYTYILGKNVSARTITQRFEVLQKEKENGKLALGDLTKAFAVGTLSDDFFAEYKIFYEDFVQYITGFRYVKQGNKWVKTKIHEINKEIFSQFVQIAKNENQNANDEEFDLIAQKYVRDYVKKLMGRLVFLQFLQKKGWLAVKENEAWGSGDKNFLYNIFNKADESVKENFLEEILEPLFFKTLNLDRGENNALAEEKICKVYGENIRIPYLNGGLFEKDIIDDTKIAFPKEFFCNPDFAESKRSFAGAKEDYPYTKSCGLFDFFSQYNFTIDETDSDEKELGVDPEMLGKIFENLLEDNKDKGAFYTPKEIVQYMCQESLIAYLQTQTNIDENAIRDFVTKKELDQEKITQKDALLIKEKLASIKICDPAVGSGAFPMGMLNELKDLHIALKSTKDLTTKDIAQIKKDIVKQNIYGVDIEKGAIDIARLRFWLSIIVDEDEPLPLPNLDYKLMQGNSLLESFEGVDLSKISVAETLSGKGLNLLNEYEDPNDAWKIQKNTEIDAFNENIKDFFDITNHDVRSKKQTEIFEFIKRRITDKLDVKSKEKRQKLLGLDGEYKKLHSDLDFLKNNKTDPAYIKKGKELETIFEKRQNLENEIRQSEKKLENVAKLTQNNSHFFLWHTWFNDVFASKGGFDVVIGNPPYIDSETMTNNGLEWERKLLQSKFENLSGNWDIYMAFFELALSLGKVVSYITPDKWLSKPFGLKFRKNQMRNRMSIITRTGSKTFENATVDGIITLFNPKTNLLKAFEFVASDKIILKSSKNISEIEEPYLIDFMFSEHSSILDKIETIKGKLSDYAICEGACATSDFYIVKDLIEENSKPNLSKYYKLINTGTIGKYHNKWDEKEISYGGKFSYPIVKKSSFRQNLGQTYIARADSPKIIFKGLNLLDVCIDENAEILPGKSTMVICSKNIDLLKFLLGFLNSKLPFFYIKNKYSSSSYCGGITFTKDMFNNLPLNATPAEQAPIISLVEKILAAKKQDSASDTSALEAKIDTLIYKLYGLTAEEIAIVEGK